MPGGVRESVDARSSRRRGQGIRPLQEMVLRTLRRGEVDALALPQGQNCTEAVIGAAKPKGRQGRRGTGEFRGKGGRGPIAALRGLSAS